MQADRGSVSRWGGIGVCLAVAALGLACRRAPRTPEEEVRAIVVSMASAVDEKQPQEILHHVSVSFRSRSEAGRAPLDFADLQSLVLEFLLREEPVRARLGEVRTRWVSADPARVRADPARVRREAEDRTLRVTAEVGFSGGHRLAGTTDPPAEARYRVELDFARREGGWLVVSGAYVPLGAVALSGADAPWGGEDSAPAGTAPP